jgi:putative Holliday junction resolvase
MRYLGIDYGRKRIGLALSDKEGKVAFPYSVVSDLKRVAVAAKKEGAGKIIIGLPVSFSGKESKQAEETRAFAEKLKKRVKLPIEFENEILSTKIASKTAPKGKLDASAAAIILQSYLDRETRNQKLETGN